MYLNVKFNLGDIVYLKTDSEQKPRIVTGFTIRNNEHIIYLLSCISDETEHYEIEITAEKDILATLLQQ